MSSHKKNKKTAKILGKQWITVWLLIVSFLFLGVFVYATYTGVNIVKRVVSTKAGGGLMFSSNYMTTTTLTSIEYGNYSDYDAEHNPEFTMTVCNYSQGDKSAWYSSGDISYSITADLYINERYTAEEAETAGHPEWAGTYKRPTSEELGTKQFGIKYLSDASYQMFDVSHLTINLPGTYSLSKLTTSMDEFSLLLDKSELLNNSPSFWIKVTATPARRVGGEVETIDGYIGVCMSASGAARWMGAIGDKNYDSIDYDAYNYIISGNGRGTFYFAWDDDKLKPNEFSLLNYGSGTTPISASVVSSWNGYMQYGSGGPSSVTSSDTWKYIEISVDSSVLARYEFQLFKTSGSDYHTVITKYVDYKFVADE